MTLLTILLQAQPNVTELGHTASELSRTTAEVGVYNMITGVFMTIVLIFVAMQAITFYKLTSKLSTISECSIKTLDYFQNKMQKEINLDQARSEISEQIDKGADSMKFQILLMRELNHIDDKESTRIKISRWLSNSYTSRFNHFKKFEYNGHILSDIMEPSFMEDAQKLMTELLYLDKSEFKVEYIHRQVDDFHSLMKGAYNSRLDNL